MKRLSAVLLALIVFPAVGVFAQRGLPASNLAYPVAVEIPLKPGFKRGSGFYLNDKRHIYLVTAKHMLLAADTLISKTASLRSFPPDFSANQNLILLDLERLQSSGRLISHKTKDIAVVVIGDVNDSKLEIVAGVKFQRKAPGGILTVDIKNAITFDQVLISNEVFIFGYPTALGLKEDSKVDKSRPLLRRGIVAGKNEETKTIILDCPAYGGNSGGPVIQVTEQGSRKHFRLIGVVTNYVPLDEKIAGERHLANSGYSVAVPMDYVLELLEEE